MTGLAALDDRVGVVEAVVDVHPVRVGRADDRHVLRGTHLGEEVVLHVDGGVRVVRHAAATVALEHVAAARLAGAERLPQAGQLRALGAVVDQEVHVDAAPVRRDQPVGRRLLAEQVHRHGDRLAARLARRAARDGTDRLVEDGLGASLGGLVAGRVVEHHPGLRRIRRRVRCRHQERAHQCRTTQCGDQRGQQSLHCPVLIPLLPWMRLGTRTRVSLTIGRLWKPVRPRSGGCCAPGTRQPRLTLPHAGSIGAMTSVFLPRHTIISRMRCGQAPRGRQAHLGVAERGSVAHGGRRADRAEFRAPQGRYGIVTCTGRITGFRSTSPGSRSPTWPGWRRTSGGRRAVSHRPPRRSRAARVEAQRRRATVRVPR